VIFRDFIHAIDPDYVIDVFQGVVIDELQASVEDPNAPGVLVSAYPGFGKTKLFTLFGLWMIHLNLMTHGIMLYGDASLATTSHTMIRRAIESPDFQDITPCTFVKANASVLQVEGNDGHPTLFSAGILSSVTGRRANWIIFDDLIKNLQTAYSETASESIHSAFDSAGQTRLLPGAKIYGIHTRWTLRDQIQRLIDQARKNPKSRQYRYINIAARNLDGLSSYRLDTRTGLRTYFHRYPTAATIPGLPISYSPADFAQKEADLGPRIFQPLYMGDPLSGDELMFPPEAWRYLESVNTDEYTLIISAWDTASRVKPSNDPSCNVIVGRRRTGDFVVLDVFECKYTSDKLLPVMLERYRRTCEMYRTPAYLCIEEADSGKFLIDIIAAQLPRLPLLRAKAVVGKIIRAEAVVPFTAAGSVSLLRAVWNERFVSDHANFPASDRDHSVDAFCHAMRAFTGTGSDFQKPTLVPAPRLSPVEQVMALLGDAEPNYPTGISDGGGFSDFEGSFEREDF
jgi:predicted phage terminase large subunit-like protein